MKYENFKKDYEMYKEWYSTNDTLFDEITEAEVEHPYGDRVDHPSHYTSGGTEAIDVIEDAICSATDVRCGFLQGQVLKYLLRLWLKDNPLEDAKKARWYLNRLIEKMESVR